MKRYRSKEYGIRLKEARELASKVAGVPPYDPKVAAELLHVKVEYSPLKGLDGNEERRQSGWCAVISNQASSTRQRFTLAHELCHVLLMRDAAQGISVPFVRYRTTGVASSFHQDPQEEALCNAFAAEFLMPRDSLRKVLAKSRFDTNLVFRVAERFQVSIQAECWVLSLEEC